jgi:hypothetical protein
MRRGGRIAVAAAVVVISVLAVVGLTRVGTVAEGPLGAALGSLGATVRHWESGLAHRVRGPGRAGRLAWLEPYRDDPARLRAPDLILLGAYEESIPGSLEGVLALEDALGQTFPLVHLYGAWGDRPEQQFPARFVEAVRSIGSVPVVTWEPWLTDFENRLHPHLPLRGARDRGGMAAIARGDYDFYLDAWARDAAAYGSPILVRFGHEMNDPYRYPWGPQNNEPWDFIAAWNHVVERFRAAGADNVLWVWSPHLAYEGWWWYYPDHETVDWVGTGALNYGSVANWSRWWPFAEIFDRHYEALSNYGKPIMIAELGSLGVGGDRAEWYRAALADLPRRYPAVRAVMFFEVTSDATVTYQELDWSIAGDSVLARTVAVALAGWPAPVGRGGPPGSRPAGQP